MNLGDYLLEQDGLDWPALLEAWEHLLPPELTVWFVNRFGEPFFAFDDGTIHRLNLEANQVESLARDRDAFAEAIDAGGNAEAWLRVSEVDAAVAAGLVLEPGQCYGYAVPLVLQGECSIENTVVGSLSGYYAFLADLHRQIRDLPDGSQVRLRVRE